MIEKTMYIADDGKAFEDEEDCREYEAQINYSDILQSVTMFTEKGKIIHFENDLSSFNDAVDYATFIFIPSYLENNRLSAFSNEIMRGYYGKIFPTTAGFYRWDWHNDNDGWISFETDVSQMTEQWGALLNITVTSERR